MPAICEIWLCVDNVGDFGLGNEEEAAKANYEETVQPLADATGFRCYCVNLTVPCAPPALEIAATLSGDEEDGDRVALTVGESA